MKKKAIPELRIVMEGGVVQGVEVLSPFPCAFKVDIRDYDTDGADEEDLKKDSIGAEYYPCWKGLQFTGKVTWVDAKRKRTTLKLDDVGSPRGAPMGRRNRGIDDPQAITRLRLQKLRLVDGDYDTGGAYWGGTPGTDIYCAWSDEYDPVVRVFVRAKSPFRAVCEVVQLLPNATFACMPTFLCTHCGALSQKKLAHLVDGRLVCDERCWDPRLIE